MNCDMCGGEGVIITCCDDLCVGGGHCIHGDGEEICPQCEGEGWLPDQDDDDSFDDPHPFDFMLDEDEDAIAREEYAMTHSRCASCGNEYGDGWTNCVCDEWEGTPC